MVDLIPQLFIGLEHMLWVIFFISCWNSSASWALSMIRVLEGNKDNFLIVIVSYWNLRLTIWTAFIWTISIVLGRSQLFNSCAIHLDARLSCKACFQAVSCSSLIQSHWTVRWVLLLWTGIRIDKHLNTFAPRILTVEDKWCIGVEVLLWYVTCQSICSSRPMSMIMMVMDLIICELRCWYRRNHSASLPLTMIVSVASTLIRVCGVHLNHY